MKHCEPCQINSTPLGRAPLEMSDGGRIELIVLQCPKCREIRFEHASHYSFNSPKPNEGERLRDYLERTL